MNKFDLFRDVLNEGTAPDFEEAIFRKTVATAKRTHRTRVAVRCGLVTITVAFVALFTWPRREVVMVTVPPQTPIAVASHDTIQTQRFENVIRTETANSQQYLATTVSSVSILTTSDASSGVLRFINDEELLGLFQGKAVALVNRGRENAELILLDESGVK
jgi:hypothetical protein